MEDDRLEARSGPEKIPTGIEKVFMFSCPYLGTLEDPDTSLAYPASANHCFRLKSAAAVDLLHQETYCLTDNHPGCHVFQQAVAAGVDEEQVDPNAPVVTETKRRRRVSIYALPLILILLIMAAIIWWPEPGTTIEQASVFGAGERQAVRSENDLAEPANVPVQGVVIEGVKPPADLEFELAEEPALESASTDSTGADSAFSPVPAGEMAESETSDKASETAEDSTVDVAEVGQSAGSVIEDEVAIAGEEIQSSTDEDSEAAETAASMADESVAETVEEQETQVTAEVAVDELLEAKADLAELAVETEISSIDVDQPRIVITDLPVLASDSAEASSSPADVVASVPAGEPAVSSAGERFALIGPDVASAPALRENQDEVVPLFVRQGPGTESDLLAMLTRRQQVSVLGRDPSGSWIKVRLDNELEGWVDAIESRAGIAVSGLPMADAEAAADSAEAVPQPVAAAVVSSLPVVRSAVVNTGALNLRSGPGVAYEPISIIYSGEAVGLLGRQGSGVWVRVRTADGLEGWMNSTLLAPLS